MSLVPLSHVARMTTRWLPQAARALTDSATGFSQLLHGPKLDREPSTGAAAASQLPAGDQAIIANGSPGPAVAVPTPEQQAARQALQTDLDRWAQDFVSALHQRHVDLQQPAVLSLDSMGHLLEQSGHLDRAVIEQTLEDRPDLARRLRSLLERAAETGASSGNPIRAHRAADLQLVVHADHGTLVGPGMH